MPVRRKQRPAKYSSVAASLSTAGPRLTAGTTIADNLLEHTVGGFNQDEYVAVNGQADNYITVGFGAKEAGLHSAQKPLKLMEALIALGSRRGHIVLDPFAGSGSTLVAAQRLGRQFIGIELDLGVAEKARARLVDSQLPLRPS